MVEELLLVVVVGGVECAWGGGTGSGCGGCSRITASSRDCCNDLIKFLLHCIHCCMMCVGLRRS